MLGGAVSLAGAYGLDRMNVLDLFGDPGAGSAGEIPALRDRLDEATASTADLRAELESRIAALGDQQGGSGDTAAIAAQVENLQREITELAGTAGVDLQPFEARLGALEQLVGSGASGRDVALESLESRIATSVDAVKALQGTVGDGSRWDTRIDEAKAGVTDLTKRLETMDSRQTETATRLEESIAALQGAVNETRTIAENAASADSVQGAVTASAEASRKAEQAVAIAPVLAAESLQRAVDAGQPFENALNAFRSLGIDDPALSALEPFAADGLPTAGELRSEFAALAATFQQGSGAAEDEPGAVGRLMRSAFSVVKVSPVEPQAGDNPLAIQSRISGALAGNDLETALEEWQTLPEDSKAASRAWADKARAIVLARNFADTVRADALTRLNATQ